MDEGSEDSQLYKVQPGRKTYVISRIFPVGALNLSYTPSFSVTAVGFGSSALVHGPSLQNH
jgi:hypothetical protein